MGVHQCEQWQMRESAKGGWYCAACGQPEKPKDMAAVLLAHQPKTGVRDMLRHCLCGWKGSHLPSDAAARQFLKHQADALEAAGYQKQQQEVVEVVADSSKVFMVMCQDVEAHARSYNEGYEAAVTQGLADDPSLAGEWLDGKLAEAFAYGWREGRGVPTPVDCDTGELLHREALQPDFNPYQGEAGQ